MATMDEIANGLIIKSFVPGKGVVEATETVGAHMKGWKPASQLSRGERKKIIEHHKTTGMYRRMGLHESNEQYARGQGQVKHKLWEGHKTQMNRKVTVNRKNTKLGEQPWAGWVLQGQRARWWDGEGVPGLGNGASSSHPEAREGASHSEAEHLETP